jgi:hypothetical protein
MAKVTCIGPNPLPVVNGGTGQTSGTTGSVNVVLSNTPTLTTPTLGVATATSVSFSPTTQGVVATATNNNASAGYVGEVFSSVQTSNVSFTTGQANNLTSITVTAGDWDVYCQVALQSSGGSITYYQVWTSTTSASLPSEGTLVSTVYAQSGNTSNATNAPYLRVNVSGSTTIYASCFPSASGTLTGTGTLYARRAR